MVQGALFLTTVGLAPLIGLAVDQTGMPLKTPDGFPHLNSAVEWVKQLKQRWLSPAWRGLTWSGVDRSALLIYVPLFRQLIS